VFVPLNANELRGGASRACFLLLHTDALKFSKTSSLFKPESGRWRDSRRSENM